MITTTECYDCGDEAEVRVIQQNTERAESCYTQAHCLPCARHTGGGVLIPLPNFWR